MYSSFKYSSVGGKRFKLREALTYVIVSGTYIYIGIIKYM